MSKRKYDADTLANAFLIAADLRKKMLDSGFTDNGGAIHSAERIMNILGLALNHASLSHINDLKKHPDAECSEAAHKARQCGDAVFIEHVAPLRALTRAAIEHLAQIPADMKEQSLKSFVKKHYRLALLTRAETDKLNKLNRSKMTPDRLESAGITILRLMAR